MQDSNTGFLCENPIRKGKIHTAYGFCLCTQFSSTSKLLNIQRQNFIGRKNFAEWN